LIAPQAIEEATRTYLVPWGVKALIALAIFVIGQFIAGRLVALMRLSMERTKRMDPILIRFLSSILQAILLVIILMAVLAQLGVDTTSMVALVGAAGLAVGLALKDSLQNFAAGVLLVFLRPFHKGDMVDAAGTSGVVEQINIFSSTLCTPDNVQITVPNGQIFNGVIRNHNARETRRVDMVLPLALSTDVSKVRTIVKELLAADVRVLPDPVPFIAVGDITAANLTILVRPWVRREDYFNFKCDFLEQVKARFDAEGINFPKTEITIYKNSE